VTKKVVVTGGLGFVGHALIEQLVREGSEVLVVDDTSLGRLENLAEDVRQEIRFEATDIRYAERLESAMAHHKPDVIFHLAAIHFIPLCDRDPQLTIRVNAEGTQSVVQAAARLRAGSFVLASTAAVYAPSLEPHVETSAVAPTDIYGLTKLWSEHIVDLFHRRTQTPVGIVRLFNAVGPGESNPHLVPTVIEQLRKGRRLELGNLETERDYVHVHDAATGFIAMARGLERSSRIVANIGAERAVSGKQIVRTIGELMGIDPIVHQDTNRMRVSDRPRLLSNCSLAHDTLRWETRRSLTDALRDAINDPRAVGVSFD